MNTLVEKIAESVERGKINKASPYPDELRGEDGADEFTRQALSAAIEAEDIVQACNEGMRRVGEKFVRHEVFVPEMLMSAKAMKAVMAQLEPIIQSGNVKSKGKFILGTVAGDLHDIGKNLVAMFVKGSGWEVIDLGVDVGAGKFIDAIKQNPGCAVGLSALLTTTMAVMAKTVQEIKTHFPETRIIVGGAPLSADAANKMGADRYAPNPQEAVAFLTENSAKELVRTSGGEDADVRE
jgi:5-methyltetrahydrofolate--homocysteine methyltransferase